MEAFRYFIAFLNIVITFFVFPGILVGTKRKDSVLTGFFAIMVFVDIASAVMLCKQY